MTADRYGDSADRAKRGKEMLREGKTQRQVADALGLKSRSQVIRWAAELRDEQNGAAEVTTNVEGPPDPPDVPDQATLSLRTLELMDQYIDRVISCEGVVRTHGEMLQSLLYRVAKLEGSGTRRRTGSIALDHEAVLHLAARMATLEGRRG